MAVHGLQWEREQKREPRRVCTWQNYVHFCHHDRIFHAAQTLFNQRPCVFVHHPPFLRCDQRAARWCSRKMPALISLAPLWCVIVLLASTAACSSDHRLAQVRTHGDHRLTHVRKHGDLHHRRDAVPPYCSTVATINGTTTEFHVYHCPVDRAYLFKTRHLARPSFLVRIVGPHTLFTGLSREVDAHTQAFTYSLRHAGRHHAVVRVLLEDVPRNNVTDACLARLPVVNHTFHVKEDETADTMLADDAAESCCWQTPNTLTNHWPAYADVSSNTTDMRSRYNDLALNTSRLLSDDALTTCLAHSTSICLYGDSQTRNLRDSLQAFLSERPAISMTLTYTLLRYPVNLTDALHATHDTPCTHHLFNYGHWPLGWVEYRPWTFDELESELAAFLPRIADLPGHTYWVSTEPFPQNHPRVVACPPQDWRMLTHIDTYNDIAKRLVHNHHPHIHYIDTFRPMLHLHDFTYDGSHYQEPVAAGVARVVLSRLCERR
jgi:hypothetical protein